MTSYTNTFTGNPVQTSPTQYVALTIASNTTLSWPISNEDDANVAADVMEITASAASLIITMPPANQVSNGQSCLMRNVGANSFTVVSNNATSIQVIAAGEVFWVYVTDNSTAAGIWSSFQFGTGTSAANAAALAGNGLVAISTLLNTALPTNDFNANFTLLASYRATLANWTGGAGTFSFSPAATLGDDWFILIKNSGSGSVVLNPDGSETIDGASTITLATGESCFVLSTGTALLSVSKNTVLSISFTRLVKSVAGSSDVTLTSGEAAYDVQEYTGLLTGDIDVIVPTAVSRWYVYNNTTGSYTLTVKTVAGTGITVTQGTRQILYCDGTNVVKAVDSGTGTVTSIATGTGLSGGPITSSGTISIANTAVSAGSYGTSSSIPAIVVNAQGQLTSAANTAVAITEANFSGVLPVSKGGFGGSSLTANAIIVGSGTNAPSFLNPGSSGNKVVSNGTSFSSQPTTPQVTVYTSGSGTYNTPSGAILLKVTVVGGGGGSGGSGTSGGSGGGTGGSSTFGTLTAAGGVGSAVATATSSTGGAGGTATNGDINWTGQQGGTNWNNSATTDGQGPAGGTAVIFAGAGNTVKGGTASMAGIANTGGGGSGTSGDSSVGSSGGGGGGGALIKWISSPSATYSYGVGAAGTAGTAGTSGRAGAAGGSGLIIVEAFF